MDLPLPSLCPCCIPGVAVPLITTALAILLTLRSTSLGKRSALVSFLLKLVACLALLSALLLSALGSSQALRNKFFSSLCLLLSRPGPLDAHRCPLVQRAAGKVLEIGPGPGTNFRCFAADPDAAAAIASYVGVEPNPEFGASLRRSAAEHDLPFPISTTWLTAELGIDAPPGSFDTVISTHVLCSVQDPGRVLENIREVLRPGGTFLFMEHVLAPPGSAARLLQQIAGPSFKILADGCQFRDLWGEIEGALGDEFEFGGVEQFDAPMPLPMFVPHVKGWARKR